MTDSLRVKDRRLHQTVDYDNQPPPCFILDQRDNAVVWLRFDVLGVTT